MQVLSPWYLFNLFLEFYSIMKKKRFDPGICQSLFGVFVCEIIFVLLIDSMWSLYLIEILLHLDCSFEAGLRGCCVLWVPF